MTSLKRKSESESVNAANSKKLKSNANDVTSSSTSVASSSAGPLLELEDVVSGDRKKRLTSKKKPKRISKHIREAQARKAAKENENGNEDGEKKEGEGEGEGESVKKEGDDTVKDTKKLAPKPKPAPTPSAAATSLAESKILALDYLNQWATTRESWKFQKIRQIWLLEHAYDKDAIGKKEFALLCDYIQDLKGVARTVRQGTCYFFTAARILSLMPQLRAVFVFDVNISLF